MISSRSARSLSLSVRAEMSTRVGGAGDRIGNAAVGGRALRVEDARLVVGIEQLGAVDIDGDGADDNRAGRARERRHDGLGGVVGGSAGVHRQPVLARERGGVGDAAQLRLQLRDFTLDLVAVDAGLAGRHQLALDLVDHLDGAVDAGVGDIDGGGAEPQGVLHRGQRHVVGAHGGGDRPVGGVVGCVGNPIAGGDAALGLGELDVGLGERLQRRHRCDVRVDAAHLQDPRKVCHKRGLTGRQAGLAEWRQASWSPVCVRSNLP